MIELPYDHIDAAITALTTWLGSPTTTSTGRPIGERSQMSKAKWLGPGWIIHTDHFRTGNGSQMAVRAFLSFADAKNETIWRLKHPDIGS